MPSTQKVPRSRSPTGTKLPVLSQETKPCPAIYLSALWPHAPLSPHLSLPTALLQAGLQDCHSCFQSPAYLLDSGPGRSAPTKQAQHCPGGLTTTQKALVTAPSRGSERWPNLPRPCSWPPGPAAPWAASVVRLGGPGADGGVGWWALLPASGASNPRSLSEPVARGGDEGYWTGRAAPRGPQGPVLADASGPTPLPHHIQSLLSSLYCTYDLTTSIFESTSSM